MRARRVLLLITLVIAIAAPAARAGDPYSASWNVRWPSARTYATYRFWLPATTDPVEVMLDDWASLSVGSWTYLACPTFDLRASRATYYARYYTTRTLVVLTLKSGRFCFSSPTAGDWSRAEVTYYR